MFSVQLCLKLLFDGSELGSDKLLESCFFVEQRRYSVAMFLKRSESLEIHEPMSMGEKATLGTDNMLGVIVSTLFSNAHEELIGVVATVILFLHVII